MKKNVLNTDLTGKVVVVTGAGGVLCSGFAKVLARAGAKVALLDLNEEAAKGFADTTITVSKNGNAVKASQLMKLMGLGIKQGDVVTVTADGPSEDAAIAAMQSFFQEHL